jgi:hypothetical protein
MTTDFDWDPSDPENKLGRYILDQDGNPVPEPDLFRWGAWLERSYETGERRVAETEIADGIRVSTVFLALDHNYTNFGIGERETPILFETMCFDDYGSIDDEELQLFQRYATRAEALEGHEAIVTELKLKLAQHAKS